MWSWLKIVGVKVGKWAVKYGPAIVGSIIEKRKTASQAQSILNLK